MKEAQNQIRYHRFIDFLDKRKQTEDISKSDEDMKNLWVQRQSKSNLIIRIHELHVVFTLLSMGLLLSFAVFSIENTVFAKEGIKFRQKWTKIETYMQNKMFVSNKVYGSWVYNT